MQLKSFLIHFWLSNLKTDHFHNINFLALLKFAKYETTNQTPFSHFPYYLIYRCTARHLPDKRTGKSGHDAHLAALPGALCFCVFPGCKSDVNYNLFTGLTGRYTSSQNSLTRQYINLLSNSMCRHKRNVLLTRNVA